MVRQYNFNDKEKEICVFLSAIEILKNAVNKNILSIGKCNKDVTVLAKDIAQEKLFLALAVDLISKVGNIFPRENKSTLELLFEVSKHSLLTGTELSSLKDDSKRFIDWMDEKSLYGNFNFPSKEINVSLAISNRDIILICGNSAKHNFNRLDSMRKVLEKIIEENHINDIMLSNNDLIFMLRDFYDFFVGDNGFIAKYIYCLSYFMNELLWDIYYSLQEVYYDHYLEKRVDGFPAYEYIKPEGLSEEGFALFWNLMNEVRHEPYIQRFKPMDIWLKPDTYDLQRNS